MSSGAMVPMWLSLRSLANTAVLSMCGLRTAGEENQAYIRDWRPLRMLQVRSHASAVSRPGCLHHIRRTIAQSELDDTSMA